ncbi:MAG: site-specific integrase [Candidatus Dormiibacterota bacterium]
MTTPLPFPASPPGRSPFAGADVCQHAGLTLPPGTRRPGFDDDLWDFTDVSGLPVSMPLSDRRFSFTPITSPRWRMVAKELIFAMLAPRHEAVALLPRANRTPVHLHTASARLEEASRFLNWLTSQGVASLGEVGDHHCEAYLFHRRHVLDEHGTVVGERSPGTRRRAAQVIIDLLNYGELFTADRPDPGLRPWGGATATAVAEMPSGRAMNKTPPLSDDVLRPMLAAALYLTSSIGPHAVTLNQQVREADQQWGRSAPGEFARLSRAPVAEITRLLDRYQHDGIPLPMLPGYLVSERIAAGWEPGDPLLAVGLNTLARQAGISQFTLQWLGELREPIEAAVSAVGVQELFARNRTLIDRPDGHGQVPWSPPLHRLEAVALVGVVRTATALVIAAVSGMRASELMELQVGCRLPPEEPLPGLARFRLASKLIKGQPLGGTRDEWVVIEPAYQAAGLAGQLHDAPADGNLLFGRIAFSIRYKWLRNWVNGPSGRRLGLTPIPDYPVTLRALRRTLAIELAYRPGGVLATKFQLKHIAAATTEGYASRPGGAQAELLAEVNQHESERNLALLWEEFRNYQQGIMPAGPGARELTEIFAHIDAKLDPAEAPAAKVQRSDREILGLLTKRARVLHLGTANYCWFTDPSRALCLRLAGDPAADKPLIGMCDSARCPQATHHPCHRPVWAQHAEQTRQLLIQLGPTRKTEKARLQADYDRAARVLDRIDEAAAAGGPR